MSLRGLVAGALLLVLWPGPAHARAPEPVPAQESEVEAPLVEGEALTQDEPLGATEAEPEDAADEVVEREQATPEEPAAPAAPRQPPAPTVTHDVPAADYEAESGVAPGGYHGFGVILERPPPDGHNRIVVGSILVPLGAIATVSSAVGTWLSVPAHCAERLAATGVEADAERCQGLFTFNVIRVSYGALMLASGATILALGIIQRERYRKWRHEHGMRAHIEPMLGIPSRRAASLGLRLRF